MEGLFLKLAELSVTAIWLILAVIILRLIFRKAPKWIFCIMWGLVALRLLLPVSVESRLSLIPSSKPVEELFMGADSKTDVRNSADTPADGSYGLPETLNTAGTVNYTATEVGEGETGRSDIPKTNYVYTEPGLATEKSPSASHRLPAVLSWLWLAGAAGMLIYAVVSSLMLRRRVMTAVRLEDNIFLSEFVSSPFLLGIISPRIYLPYGVEGNDREYVIAHEKAHIARLDHIWKPFGFILLSVYWFNPFMWAAYILLSRDIETACDEKVISGMEAGKRASYSAALLNAGAGINRRRIAACPLAFGEISVKSRIKNVMNYKKPVFWIVVAAVVGCVVLAVCFLTNPVSDKAEGAGSQSGTGEEKDLYNMTGNRDGSIPTFYQYNTDDIVGLTRSESGFSENLYDAIHEDWDKWQAMDEFSRMASSHLAGCCHRYFETWEEATEFIGVDLWNPLEHSDLLKKMNYCGTDTKDVYHGGEMLPHCSMEWLGTCDEKLTFAEITTGYAVDDVRVTLRIELYNNNADNSSTGGITMTNDRGELWTSKEAGFRNGYDYTLRLVTSNTGDNAASELDSLMDRLFNNTELTLLLPVDPGTPETIPGTDTNNGTDYFINTGDDASYGELQIEFIGGSDDPENAQIKVTGQPDTSNGLQIVVWQMAAESYSCILLPRDEEINAYYLIGGGSNNPYLKNIIASGKPDGILQELEQYGLPDEDIVVRVVQNPISSYINPLSGTDAYLDEVGAQFGGRFAVERGVVVYK